MFIISLDYQVPLEQVDQFVPEHIDYLNKHYAEGHFILSGRKEPRTGGVILSTVSDRSELNDILALDPFYREGLATYEITEMVPSKSTESLKFLL
ncbi:YciI family protein [uncultured Vibrio sp.]|uniref:YciI family protein n=1 Tax=uncultured Vibrio sp. TaxID=114054 RepID=UPI000913F9A3|nr:YciI family protein [uncultured Vibrio sp.]OIQ26521.1 MAG: GTP cyclohydrolase [Vibrio sp. MedPE-SWchi]